MDCRRRVARNLRRIRVGQGLSQEALAGDAGVDRTYVSGIEREEFNPSLDILCRLASVLGVDIVELFAKSASGPLSGLTPGRKPARKAVRAKRGA